MQAKAPFNILLVNDNPADLLALRAAREGLGENLVEALSETETLRAALKRDFAVILLDVNMPGMDGLETAAMLRQREKTAEVPILFVTATECSSAREARGYSLGAVDYIYAPVVPAVLRAKVSALVDLRRREERLLRCERREHEKRLAGLPERLEDEVRRNRFFALSIDLLVIAGFDGFARQLSPSWEPTLGLSVEKLKAVPFLDWIHPDDRDITSAALHRLLAGQPVAGFESRFRSGDGSYRWILWNAAPYPEEELIYAAGRDLTERKLAEKALVRGDRRLLRVVLENLLGNAFKFTSRTEAARLEVGCQAGRVFFVRDNGVGFDPAYGGKLFGAFERLHRADEFPGTGIGLATVERIIRRHGGRVWAESAVGQGATFYFTLEPEA
jgi:PAS domain S-box-containing protein